MYYVKVFTFSGFPHHAKKMQRTSVLIKYEVVVKMDWQNAFGAVFSALGTPLIDLTFTASSKSFEL